MERPTCKTCPYFNDIHDGDYGECRYNPPVLSPTEKIYELGHELTTGLFSEVTLNFWCGKHPDFPAYIASLKKPRTVPEMKAQIVALQNEIGTAIKETTQEFGMTAPKDFNASLKPAESRGNSVLDNLLKTVEKY